MKPSPSKQSSRSIYLRIGWSSKTSFYRRSRSTDEVAQRTKSLNGRSRSTDEVVDCRSKSSDSFNGRSHQRAECPPTEGRIYGISPTADRLVGQPCRPVSHPSHLAAATPDRSTDIGHRFRRLGSRFPWRQFKSANRLVVIMHPGCRCPGLNRHRQLQPLRA
jgi:hypothetical protein